MTAANEPDSPLQPHVGQTAVEGDQVAGHEVELVDFEKLFHLVLLVPGDENGLPHLARSLLVPRNNGWKTREQKATFTTWVAALFFTNRVPPFLVFNKEQKTKHNNAQFSLCSAVRFISTGI